MSVNDLTALFLGPNSCDYVKTVIVVSRNWKEALTETTYPCSSKTSRTWAAMKPLPPK